MKKFNWSRFACLAAIMAAFFLTLLHNSCGDSGSGKATDSSPSADQYQSDTVGPISCALCRADDWECQQNCIPQEDAMSSNDMLPDASEGDAMLPDAMDTPSTANCEPARSMEGMWFSKKSTTPAVIYQFLPYDDDTSFCYAESTGASVAYFYVKSGEQTACSPFGQQLICIRVNEEGNLVAWGPIVGEEPIILYKQD